MPVVTEEELEAEGGLEEAPDEAVRALQAAEAAIRTGEIVEARRQLERYLETQEDEEAHARYLLARCLITLSELRGARTQLLLALEADADSSWTPLIRSVLGAVHEQLGDHAQAIEVYAALTRTNPDVLEPYRGIARCQLRMNDPQAAILTLEQARDVAASGQGLAGGAEGFERRQVDPSLEYLYFDSLRRLERWDDAERAGRLFVDLAREDTPFRDRVVKVQTWLAEQGGQLEPRVRSTLVDFVRAATKLRLPSENVVEREEDRILVAGPERLRMFDERIVFVTLFGAEGSRFRGWGRGKSLAESIKGALESITQQEEFRPFLVREAAVRIDVGHSISPAAIVAKDGVQRLDPPFQRGLQGLAARADGRQIFCLPGDPASEGLGELTSLLEFAGTAARLGQDAWQSGGSALFTFETISFLSYAPGVRPISLRGADPVGDQDQPQPLAPDRLRRSLERGGRWLLTLLRSTGDPLAEVRVPHGPSTKDPQAMAPSSEVELSLAFQGLAQAGLGGAYQAAADRTLDSALRRLEELKRVMPAEQRRLTLALGVRALARLGDAGRALELAERTREIPASPELDPLLAHGYFELLAAAVGRQPMPQWLSAEAWARLGAHGSQSLTRPGGPREVLAWLAALRVPGYQARIPLERLAEWVRQEVATPRGARAETALSLEALARCAALTKLPLDREARAQARTQARIRAAALVSLQLDEPQRYFLAAPDRLLGAFRSEPQRTDRLTGRTGAQCLQALLAVESQ